MKLLLTDSGITNPSIQEALVDLLGKPISESTALCIPTAAYAQNGGTGHAWRLISGNQPIGAMVELPWQSVGVLELTALPSVDESVWLPSVREADALLVGGGDPMYLCHWMRESGLAGLLPTLSAVYVGMSAGSMVLTPRIGEDFVRWSLPGGGDETLGLVDFSLFPHLDFEGLPDNTMANAEKWAAGLSVPSYATDVQTAVKVNGDQVEVVSEGHWKHFTV
ncbi:Type 1 glutamine amidotransferase-like domain-containing protein [Kribbella sp. NPDC051620]|uniref:Type 1 glutamine amidotransferase-like domain-containing protein n=1 Tax=Kribbella sp. NPDC051620 TaxID=3364120 RepID=UPI0037B8616D